MARSVNVFRGGNWQLSAFSWPRLLYGFRYLCPRFTDVDKRRGSCLRVNGT